MIHRLLFVLVAVVLSVLSGCDEDDLGSLKIKLNKDSSGVVTAVMLAVPAGGESSGSASTVNDGGVTWNTSATIVTRRGQFANLSDVKFGDMRFEVDRMEGGTNVATIWLPRGPQAKWPGLFTPTAPADRDRINNVLAEDGSGISLGKNVKLEITLPSKAVSTGVTDAKGGINASADRMTATLLVPVATALKDGPQIKWNITWEDAPAAP